MKTTTINIESYNEVAYEPSDFVLSLYKNGYNSRLSNFLQKLILYQKMNDKIAVELLQSAFMAVLISLYRTKLKILKPFVWIKSS